MDPAHLHLLLNHLPIVGLAFAMLALVVSLLMKSVAMRRLSYVLIVAASISAIPTFLTGEPAEERVEDLLTSSHDQIEIHEEQGEVAMWISVGIGILALCALYVDWKNLSFAKPLMYIVLIAGLGNLIFMYRVGESGGQIRHTELRSGATATTPDGNTNANPGESNSKPDDDD